MIAIVSMGSATDIETGYLLNAARSQKRFQPYAHQSPVQTNTWAYYNAAFFLHPPRHGAMLCIQFGGYGQLLSFLYAVTQMLSLFHAQLHAKRYVHRWLLLDSQL
jgi:hypothetical protein